MSNNQDTIKKKPLISFQVSEADKIEMDQDAKDIGESVSSIMRGLKIKYWPGYIKKQKALLKK